MFIEILIGAMVKSLNKISLLVIHQRKLNWSTLRCWQMSLIDVITDEGIIPIFPICLHFLIFLGKHLLTLCRKINERFFLKIPTKAKLARQLKMFSLVEINICNFIKYSLEKASTFSFACTVKGLAEVFLCFPTLTCTPQCNCPEKKHYPQKHQIHKTHSYKDLRGI